jgi:hypothetical protein
MRSSERAPIAQIKHSHIPIYMKRKHGLDKEACHHIVAGSDPSVAPNWQGVTVGWAPSFALTATSPAAKTLGISVTCMYSSTDILPYSSRSAGIVAANGFATMPQHQIIVIVGINSPEPSKMPLPRAALTFVPNLDRFVNQPER